MNNPKYIECNCLRAEHTLRFNSIIEDYPEVYVDIFLEHDIWYKRLWNGIKYIFGYKCKYGHFEEVIINYDKAVELRDYLTDFIIEAGQNNKKDFETIYKKIKGEIK